jgi:hypothetical protein
MYGRVIWWAMILTGIVYSIGYVSIDIREVLSDGVPMSPAIVGIAVLFCLGGALGLSLAMALAPSSYFSSAAGKRELNWDRTSLPLVTRTKAALTSLFILFVTAVVLYLAFIKD